MQEFPSAGLGQMQECLGTGLGHVQGWVKCRARSSAGLGQVQG